KVEHQIKLDETQRSFRSLTIRVKNNDFFVSDGTVPIIYKGNTSDWTATKYMENKLFFSFFQPISDTSLLFRTQRASSGEHVLGKLNVSGSTTFELYDHALQKQIDGVFDTDGTLIRDEQTAQIMYLYSYRNHYVVYETLSNGFTIGKNLDTMVIAKI